jgi:UDP-N-acetyl-D-mannosaminuronic acid dehydrogenase
MAGERAVVVGLGYVGLPLACLIAESGMMVTGIDVDTIKVRSINQGICPIIGEEPGLAELLRKVTMSGNLIAKNDVKSCEDAEAVFVCVDTPIDARKEPDLSILKKVVKDIAPYIKKGALVSIESTLPPRTMNDLVIPLLENGSGLKVGRDMSLVHCPERVMPGKLLSNMRNVERVLGGVDDISIRKGAYFYSMIVHAQIHPTDLLSAEISKTAENAYRDVQIAFANEVGLLCEQLGADAFEVRRLVNTCPFRDMHIPGAGVGGHCLPKDSWLLLSASPAYRSRVIAPARSLNEEMPLHTAQLARGLLDENVKLRDPKISVLGLAFLRDSDDTRNSPAIRIIDELVELYANVVVHDPFVKKPYKVPLTKDLDGALCGSDCAVFVTDHSVYRDLTPVRIKEMMRTPVLVDGRNLFNQRECVQLGIIYKGVGKG